MEREPLLTPIPVAAMRPTARFWREGSLWKISMTDDAWVIEDLFEEIDNSGAEVQAELYDAGEISHNRLQRTLVLSFPAAGDEA